jgi:sugar phosphate permease
MANMQASAEGETTTRASSLRPSIDKEKAAIEQQEHSDTGPEHALTAEELEFRRAERRVVSKLDMFVCPILIILQLISFLDRGNIGYAATQGMIQDINLVGTQLNTAISLFYPLYILAEFPAALIVKRMGFNRVIPTAALCWGAVCLANGFVQNFAGLAVCRLLLGMFEGFLFPSLTLMLANW